MTRIQAACALSFATLLVLIAACADRRDSDRDDLLHNLVPIGGAHVSSTRLLTDGVVGNAGGEWRSALTAVFEASGAFVEYDLGRRRTIEAAYLQADANDRYAVSVSDDGKEFQSLWTAGVAEGVGLQARSARGLGGAGRYVRLSVDGGDGKYSVAEVALYEHTPTVFPPRFSSRSSAPTDELLRSETLMLGAALALFVLLARGRARWWWTLLLLPIPVVEGVRWYGALLEAWPAGSREVALLRGVTAAVAVVAVLREALATPRTPAHRGAVVGTLAVCAALATACFYNLGRAQFYDHEHNAPGYVHNYDMRVYYPVAKYFRELRFDGLYEASVAAYIDDDPAVSVASLAEVQLRDLRTHRMVKVGDISWRIDAVRKRFTPGRWREFVGDMRYFRRNMGVHDYLGSMGDHGGNATPAWFTIAHLIFAHTHASNATLLTTAALDPLLLALAFFAIARAFGVRTMLVSLIVFGANDFYMFGTDWAGATLRHDWLAYLAIGAALLHSKRFMLGGAVLGMAAMMRAFPALALVGAAIPATWWWLAETWRRRRPPPWRVALDELRPTLRVAAGALLVAVVLVAISSVLFLPSIWTAWMHKVALLDSEAAVNDVSLRALLGGSGGGQSRLLHERMPVFIVLELAFGALVVAAARHRSMGRAAVLGLVMVPVVFNPANYYSHLVFLYPLVAVEQRSGALRVTRFDGVIWVLVLGLCAAQYGTVLVTDLGLHFYLATALLFGMLVSLLVALSTRSAPAETASSAATPAATPPGVLAHVADAPAPAAPHDSAA